jgi:hypothetical protein
MFMGDFKAEEEEEAGSWHRLLDEVERGGVIRGGARLKCNCFVCA